MATVVVERETNAKAMTVDIDGDVLTFSGKTAKQPVAAGDHRMTWIVEGKGSSYKIKITSPSSVHCGRTVEHTTKEIVTGGCLFTTT